MVVCTEKDNDFILYKKKLKIVRFYSILKIFLMNIGIIINLNLPIENVDLLLIRLLLSSFCVNLLNLVILFINALLVMKKKLFLILVRLVFVLHVITNTMKLDLYLFILNFLNPNIVMLFLLFLKYLDDTLETIVNF